MSNLAFTSQPSHASDAAFRAWGLAISTALAAVGLVQTSDTGQVNWASATRGSVGTDGGYEIWRFNDSLQATVPIYFRINYGTAAGNSNYPRIRIEVGTGSNGSGTITGTGSGTTVLCTTVNAGDAVDRSSWMACDGSGLVFAPWVDTADTGTAGATIVIERFRDDDGSPNGKGWAFYTGYKSTTGVTLRIIDPVNGLVSTADFTPAVIPLTTIDASTSFLSTVTNNALTFPVMWANREALSVSKMLRSYCVADLGFWSTQPITTFGEDRLYRALGSKATHRNIVSTTTPFGSSAVSQAIWWED